MRVKVLPIIKYPFKNIQNQIISEYDGEDTASLLDFDLVEYNYNITINIAFNELAPTTHVAQIGSTNFKFRFSQESTIQSYFLYNINMKDIKFFIFKVDETHPDHSYIRYYYYYVDDFRIINENLYEYDLTIDVIKTYLPEIMSFRNVKPLRYFQPTYEYFNFNNYSNYDIVDPLIPKQTDISSKVKFCHYVIDGQGKHFFTGTWTYFYMKFSSEDDNVTKRVLGYEGQDFFIIAMPKYCTILDEPLPEGKNIFNTAIYKFLLNSQFLIKAVDSDIPPFNNKLSIRENNWRFIYNRTEKTWDLEISGLTLTRLYPYYNNYLSIEFVVDVNNRTLFPKGLLNELSQVFSEDVANNLAFLFVRKRNPNNENKDNELIKYVSGLEEGADFIDVDDFNPYLLYNLIHIKNDDEYSHESLNTLFSNYEIGYQNSNKLPIDINLLRFNRDLKFTSYIKHDLLSTEEIITYVDLVNENEIFTKRSSELRRTKVTDEFHNYLYQNSNSLAIKEKQLNVWNDVKTIASGAISIASGVASGNPMGVVYTTYSAISNLFDNELQRQQHKAKMNDMKKLPLAYEAGNFNSDISYLDILPVLTVYRNSKRIDYENVHANLEDKQIYELIKYYGFYTPLIERKWFSQLFTRKLYNYIQIVDANEIILDESIINNIPSQHLTMIFHILENGVRFWTVSYIENPNQPNPEVI